MSRRSSAARPYKFRKRPRFGLLEVAKMAAGQIDQNDVLESDLSHADDRVRLSHWTPPQSGVIPHVRIGKRWFNVFWAIPLGAAMLVIAIALGQELRR